MGCSDENEGEAVGTCVGVSAASVAGCEGGNEPDGSDEGSNEVLAWLVPLTDADRELASVATPVNAAVPGIETGALSGFCATTAPHADSEKVPVE